ncbi:hypothetical protein ZIOFF_056795 [Zingiber officinale]|uniref:Hydroxyphenylpyruvate reductase n=1 Tax=Zingiber officinale TaxID=94328 RepID=A0A8J5FHC7_ZINOF|nr:hypothetical protein ZIOFF_056795 [Zingiber officinale]
MESLGVLLTFPMNAYLESELARRCKLFRLWETPPERRQEFIRSNAAAIRAIVGNSHAGADADTIDALPKLEIVSSFSVGLDKVDLDKCRERGIRVTNTPDVLTEDVADLAIGLTIALLRRICVTDRFVRSGAWATQGDYRLTTRVLGCQKKLCYLENLGFGNPIKFNGKTIGIIGLGRIGMSVAKRAEAFGCPISYYSRSEKPNTGYKYYSNLLDLASNCHVLIVACPLTDETRHIVNRDVLDALGPKGVLVNIGRGPHVDEPELVAALREGRLGGAALDVYEHEPHVPEELFGMDNVVLVPHIGSATNETRDAMADLVLQNLEAHVMNKPLLTPVV